MNERSGGGHAGFPFVWGTLFRCASPETALAELARGLALDDPTALRIEILSEETDGAGPVGAFVPGRPPWRLIVTDGCVLSGSTTLAAAAQALAAWRAHRIEQSRASGRLEVRTRDLEALHALERRLAEGRTPEALVTQAAESLREAIGADAAGWFPGPGPGPGLDLRVARPLSDEALMRIAEAVGREAKRASLGTVRTIPLPGVDELAGSRHDVSRDEITVLPVPRRGASAGYFVVLSPEVPSERALRFIQGSVNHFALHLDRVLAAAEAEQGRFRSILDSMPQSVVLADAGRRIVQANAAGRTLLEQLGTAVGEGLDPFDRFDLAEPVRRALEEGATSAAIEARLESGERLEITVSPVAGEDGRPEGVVLVANDVTESRRLHESLAQSEKLSSLGRMLSGVAHELNNPLTSVLGFSEMARSTPPGDKLTRRLTVIHEEAIRCQRIVQNLLRFARRHQPERRPLSLNEAVESSVALLAYQLRVEGIRIDTELDARVPRIYGDIHELQQAIVNLVGNAHHAIRAAGRAGTVRIRTERMGENRVALEVQDDGPGISDEIRSKIFDPFFTTKPAGQGTGLGLSLVYATVTGHGGTIEATGRPGGGATFRIELPAGARDPAESTPAPPRASERMSRVSARILVVDDETALAQMICEALAADGHTVVPASDPAEAMARIAQERFDLVVSDLKMPGLGAERLHREIARLRPGLENRLLITTGDTVSREPEALAVRIGAGLLHKPFGPDDVRRVVRASLRPPRDH